MGQNLMEASTQWANRPSDERFWTLADMQRHAQDRKERSRVKDIDLRKLRLEGREGNGLVVAGENSKALLTHFAFGQLAGLIEAPASYLRTLPSELAAQNINYGIEKRVADDKGTSMLLDCAPVNGKTVATMRAITSKTYGRIWNSDVIGRLIQLQNQGWRVPPARPSGNTDDSMARPATEADCLLNRMPGLGINPGDMIAPAGLYGSDKDMFAFLINENRQIDAGGGRSMCRGFFAENSEVGDCAFKVTTFLYSSICGNHIVWDVAQVQRSKVVHAGPKAEARAWYKLAEELAVYADSSAVEMENRIATAQRLELGKNKDEVIKNLYDKRLAPRAQIGEAFIEAERHPEDGHVSPRSVWGMVQGYTRLAQKTPYADARVNLDRTASKILALAN